MSCRLLARGSAARKPMFQFAFERGLLRFRAKRPAFDPLSQLPPRMAARAKQSGPQRAEHHCLTDFIHPPSIRPISVS